MKKNSEYYFISIFVFVWFGGFCSCSTGSSRVIQEEFLTPALTSFAMQACVMWFGGTVASGIYKLFLSPSEFELYDLKVLCSTGFRYVLWNQNPSGSYSVVAFACYANVLNHIESM